MPVACEYPDLDDWTQIQDAELRKRVQNRLSQRRHREKLRKQNGGAAPTVNSRKARSDTALSQPESTTASCSASAPTPSNTSAHSGGQFTSDGRILDTWCDSMGDSIGFDADWNDLTFFNGPTLDQDTLYSFPDSQVLHRPSPVLPIRAQQLSLPTDDPRPCSCGAHAKAWMSDPHALRLSQFQAANNISQLSPLSSFPAATLSEASPNKILPPVQTQRSSGYACEKTPLSRRHSRAASDTAPRTKSQRSITVDSAVEMPTTNSDESEGTSTIEFATRKRARTTTPGETTVVDPLLTESIPKEVNGTATPSQRDENSILQEVSDLLSAIVKDDALPSKRQKRSTEDESLGPSSSDVSSTKPEDENICGSLPKIRRGTLPSGAQIIVIVMPP